MIASDTLGRGLRGDTDKPITVGRSLGGNLNNALDEAFITVKQANVLRPLNLDLEVGFFEALYDLLSILGGPGEPDESFFDKLIDILATIANALTRGSIGLFEPSAALINGIPIKLYIQSAHEELVRSIVQGEETGDLLSLTGQSVGTNGGGL